MKGTGRAKPSRKQKPERRWSSLTWADLGDWAGSRAVSRGRSYHRRGAVHDLGISAEGELVAWVVGGARYATRVRWGPRRGRRAGRLESSCSCPVGVGCKHAVAAVVAALDWIEAGEALPRVGGDDVRWALAGGDLGTAALESNPTPSDLEPYLRSLRKAQLVDLLLEISALHPEVEADLGHRRALCGGDVPAIVQRIREEIAVASAEEAWSDRWSGERSTPDYSRVQSGLESLLDEAQADAVIELGRELFEAGQEQVGASHDDGETGMAIADCLSVVFRALLQSSLPDPEKVLYAIDMSLADGYELAGGVDRIVNRRWSKRTWSAVADALARRLEPGRPSVGEDLRSSYRRDRSSGWLVFALDAAGREEEATRVCAIEAPVSGSYERLVCRLIDGRRLDEASEWAERGYAAVCDDRAGTAARLRELLRDIARRRRRWALAAAYEAEVFFERPDVPRLGELLATARKAGCEDEVRNAALRFLETGKRPERSGQWPLPATQLPRPNRRHVGIASRPAEHWDVLRDLAIEEGRPEDVLKWHDRLAPRRRPGLWPSDDAELRVARAVSSTHPERAIEIYRSAAERLIGRAQPDAYAQAGHLLRDVRDLLEASARSDEWPELLAALRESHRRKRRLMEVLDGLEGQPIVRGKGSGRRARRGRRTS